MTGAGQTAARLALDGVGLVRGQRALFAGLTLALAPGAAARVTGANGAGKTSLLRVMAGLLRPTAGRIARAGGLALAAADAAALDGALPLARALGLWAAIDGAAPAMLEEALAWMGIAHLAPVPVAMLSTGQRRRATLVRVIASGAPIWLLDEPGNGLDATAIGALEAAIARHRSEGGIVVVATHQPIALPDSQEIRL